MLLRSGRQTRPSQAGASQAGASQAGASQAGASQAGASQAGSQAGSQGQVAQVPVPRPQTQVGSQAGSQAEVVVIDCASYQLAANQLANQSANQRHLELEARRINQVGQIASQFILHVTEATVRSIQRGFDSQGERV
jgi:hypothetical protein